MVSGGGAIGATVGSSRIDSIESRMYTPLGTESTEAPGAQRGCVSTILLGEIAGSSIGLALMARYPQTVLVSCPVPWDGSDALVEDLFREEVRAVLADGFRDVYVFGTGGEGYAVDTARFEQVVNVFAEETATPGVRSMVGVIGLSTPAIVERLRIAHDAGFRAFQISLPAWGALNDDELTRFFADVCGSFPDSVFLNYNLPRTKRVLVGADYARIIPKVQNLVATKSTGGGIDSGEDLVRTAGELQHFLGEVNFAHGSMVGECSLLGSYAELAPERSREYFEAAKRRDVARMFELQSDFHRLNTDLWRCVQAGPHMDGAYDKMLVKLRMLPDFPLRLLSPYEGFGDADYQACKRMLDLEYADWLSPDTAEATPAASS
jgi:dihydrodipicolinate synthase/N-acetylneuraminate lyase